MKKLGLPVPKTTDQFTETLKAFRDNDPDGNGKNDTIPLGASGYGLRAFDMIFGAFNADPWHTIEKDGTLVAGCIQPEVKDALRYIRMLYQENLLDKDFIMIDLNKQVELRYKNTWACWWDQLWATRVWYADQYQDGVRIIGMEPIKGPEGYSSYIAGSSQVGENFVAITTACKDPVTAVKYLNFLADEDVYIRLRYGEKGIHYDWSEEYQCYMAIGKYTDLNVALNEGIGVEIPRIFMREPQIPAFTDPAANALWKTVWNNMRFSAFEGEVPEIRERGLGATLGDIIIESYLEISDVYAAERLIKSNNASVLALGAFITGAESAKKIVEAWLFADFQAGASLRKVKRMQEIEENM